MAVDIRVQCPCCGLLSAEKILEDPNHEIKPTVTIKKQTYGGKLPMDPNAPYVKHGLGKAPGAMKYEDITPDSPEKVKKWTQFFAEKMIEFGKANGLIE